MTLAQAIKWILAAAVVVVLAIVLDQSSLTKRGNEHAVTVTVANATDVLGGQYIKAAGVNVGTVHSITAVDDGRAAKLVLYIDNKVWPLTRGTQMTVRWGGTASFVNRYISLVRGASNTPIASDGTFPASEFHVPVEFDSFLDTFTPSVRENLKQFLNNGGVTLADARPGLIKTLENAPAALTQVDAVLNDLDSNETALSDLVGDGSQVVSSIDASNPGVQDLISNASTTFGALDTRTKQIASTLQTAPGLLEQTQKTLQTATPVLNEAKTVTGKLSAGVNAIDKDAGPLDSVLVSLKHVGPDAVSALSSLHSATPSLNPLLTDLTSLSPTLKSIGSQANTSLTCIRPYTPDIVAFTSDWGDFLSGTTGKDHYFRAMVQTLLPAPANVETYNSGEMKKDFPWINYAYPPPPGYAAGQPWYIDQCNEGTSSTNADDDPEANTSASELPVDDGTTTNVDTTTLAETGAQR